MLKIMSDKMIVHFSKPANIAVCKQVSRILPWSCILLETGYNSSPFLSKI